MEVTEFGRLARVRDVDDLWGLGKNRLSTICDLEMSMLRVLDESSLLEASASPAKTVVEDCLVPTRQKQLALALRQSEMLCKLAHYFSLCVLLAVCRSLQQP